MLQSRLFGAHFSKVVEVGMSQNQFIGAGGKNLPP